MTDCSFHTKNWLLLDDPPCISLPGGGGGGTRPKLGYNARHKLKIWTLRDLKTSEKGGLKDLKRVFGKFEIGSLNDLDLVIETNCQAWILNC